MMQALQNNVKSYYYLAKPGIIYGNLLTATGGFLLASKKDINFGLLLLTLLGIALVIGSACVFNNYLDRGLDIKMARTKKRAIVSGDISPTSALIYATLLSIIGFTVLVGFTNVLTVWIGVIGFVDYVVLYAIGKRRSSLGTIIGSVSGSMPVVAGYTAAVNRFDGGALILFLILTFWQMPHFFAIAMRRIKDYKAAGLPVLPVIKGARATKIQIILYVIGFIIAIGLLRVYGYAGWTFFVVMEALGLRWLYMGSRGFATEDDEKWGRKMFLFSLVIILALSVMLTINVLLI